MTFYDKHKHITFGPVGKLREVQRKWPHTDGLQWPFCDVSRCMERSSVMYADDTQKAFCVCRGHEVDLQREYIGDPVEERDA